MTVYPIGLSTGCFYKQSIFEVLQPIKASGFTILEITAALSHLDFRDLPRVREAAARIADLGLEVHSYHAPFGLHLDITATNNHLREASVEEILLSMEAARTLGAHFFTIHPGPDTERQMIRKEIDQRRDNALWSLNRIADRCRETGLKLLLENMLPHQLFGRISDLVWFREMTAGGSAGICFDTGHATLAGDVYTTARRIAEHVKVVHAHDNLHADDHLPPGRGRIDWRHLVEVLAISGFAGTITLELSGEHNGTPAVILDEARLASEMLRELFPHIA